MTTSNVPTRRLDIREKIAIAVSAVIVLASAVYWVVQIIGVRAMLELAYG